MNPTLSLYGIRLSLLGALMVGGCIGGEDKPDDSTPTDDSSVTTNLCEGGTPVNDSRGLPSGLVECPDGTLQRAQTAVCDATITADACAGTEDELYCTADADCTDGAYGKCIHGLNDFDVGPYCGCVYSCETDADCATGQVCLCGGSVQADVSWSICVPAGCTTNDDCASEECGVSSFNDGCGTEVRTECREPDTDVCRTDDDCTNSGQGEACAVNGDTWACRFVDCAIGRPLMVEGAARTAPGAARADWVAVAGPSIEGLSDALRSTLAGHWASVAALEHASVASFARFTLQLLALGAPPELLADAQRASADEVEHARLTYGLASAFAGRDVGPGPLDLGDLGVHTDRRAVIAALIEEACVGETLGVAEAAAAASFAVDPAVKAALSRIAEDELRHAGLAWRTLRWLLEGADAELRAFAAVTLERALAAVVVPEDLPHHPDWGLLGAEARRQVHRAAICGVIRPCAEAAGIGMAEC
ncbi:MAG: ferritin-like domain-containing protein [Alphaproteobacteria bacterium]|nr:ferritin-like domain-containing protein [Alphaproteobacteria bacterium]